MSYRKLKQKAEKFREITQQYVDELNYIARGTHNAIACKGNPRRLLSGILQAMKRSREYEVEILSILQIIGETCEDVLP